LALLHPHSHDSQLVLRGAGTVKIETDCGICSNRLRKVESNAEFGGGCSEVDPKYLGLDRKFSSPNKFSQEFKMKNYFPRFLVNPSSPWLYEHFYTEAFGSTTSLKGVNITLPTLT
jgi:hypothetical protein